MTDTADIIGKVDEPAPHQAAPVSVPGNRPCILVDYERYAHFLDDADLTDSEKREFAQAIWSLIFDFVSLGFGVHPLQRARNDRDKIAKSLPTDLSDLITWQYPSQNANKGDCPPPRSARDREREES